MAAPTLAKFKGWAVFAVAALSGAVFLSGLTAPFTFWDDPIYVTQSLHTQAPGWLGFTRLFRVEAALDDGAYEFFPLRDVLYWVLWQLFAANPIPYHALSLGLHVLTVVLVHRWVLRLGFSSWVALVAALVFGTHPVHVESVTWISALKDPLFLSQMMGSMLFYLRYRETQRPLDYGLSLVLLVGALLSKSLALPTCVLMLAAERCIGSPTPWRLVAVRLLGPFAICGLFFVQFVLVGHERGLVWGPHGGSWAQHWFLVAWAFLRYVQQAFVPFEFRLFHCFAPFGGATDLRAWAIALGLPALAGLAVLAWRKDKRLFFLWLWFFACLLPVANLIPFQTLMNDRFLYAPSVATAIASALLLERVRLRALLVAAVAVVFSATTVTRAAVWQHERALWDEVVSDPVCWQGSSMLAINPVLQWAMLNPDPTGAIEDLHRAQRHPGWRLVEPPLRCAQFSRSVLGERQNDPLLELRAAELGASMCARSPVAWERLAIANWKNNPSIALRAAARAYALEKKPLRRWQLGLARLNVKDTSGAAELEVAAREDSAIICPLFARWFEQADEATRQLASGTSAACGGR